MNNNVEKFEKKNNVVTIDSREVAEMLEKDHAKLMRDIRKYCEYLAEAKIGLGEYFIGSSYLDANNQSRPCYLITKKGCEICANKMTGAKGVVFTAKYVERFNQMEKVLQEELTPKLPTTYKEALIELVRSIEEREKLEEEKKVLIEEKKELQVEVEHKEDIIICLVDDVSIAEKRQRISQIIRHNAKGKFQERYKLLYDEFNKKYHIDVNKRLKNAKERGEVKKSVNVMGYICDYMNKTAELYELAAKIFENDVQQLMQEMWNTIAS